MPFCFAVGVSLRRPTLGFCSTPSLALELELPLELELGLVLVLSSELPSSPGPSFESSEQPSSAGPSSGWAPLAASASG